MFYMLLVFDIKSFRLKNCYVSVMQAYPPDLLILTTGCWPLDKKCEVSFTVWPFLILIFC